MRNFGLTKDQGHESDNVEFGCSGQFDLPCAR